MQKIIISDTSCLVLLAKINCIDVLHQLFGTITITQEIADEFENDLPNWFEINNPINKNYQKILEASLDKGEASAIALAIENTDSLLIIDELKGRKYAEKLGLLYTGTLGILIDAKHQGYVPSIKPILESIRATNFRLSEVLEKMVIEKAGEL